MPALPITRNTLRGLAGTTAQRVAATGAALRTALARLVSNAGSYDGTGRRTR